MIALPGPAHNLRPLIYPPSYIQICILVLSAPPPVYRELRLELWEHTQYDKALMIMNNLATTVQNMTEYTIPVGGVNLRNLWTSFHSKCRVLAYVHKTTLLCSLKKNYVPTTIAARTHTHTHTHTCARTHTHTHTHTFRGTNYCPTKK